MLGRTREITGGGYTRKLRDSHTTYSELELFITTFTITNCRALSVIQLAGRAQFTFDGAAQDPVVLAVNFPNFLLNMHLYENYWLRLNPTTSTIADGWIGKAGTFMFVSAGRAIIWRVF